MDHIDQHLATSATKDTLPPCIKAALAVGKRLLNKYYSFTDHSEVYRIAMGKCIFIHIFSLYINTLSLVLHPSHKLDYFQRAGWDDEWKKTAEGIVRAEFERAYAIYEVDNSVKDINMVRFFFF